MLPLVALKEVTPGPAAETTAVRSDKSHERTTNARRFDFSLSTLDCRLSTFCVKSFNINTYEKCVRNSFRFCTYVKTSV